ncbi:unnamed protein product [Ambrosiozyma monospora]|uniref:Unnamed protein product n=1 Tax=Ambrosiozyma monospora TaxID=43982 RepID=A0A9W7DL41_AMBMO|nr:unnamed protein product [Ambrosiozyma monospora]
MFRTIITKSSLTFKPLFKTTTTVATRFPVRSFQTSTRLLQVDPAQVISLRDRIFKHESIVNALKELQEIVISKQLIDVTKPASKMAMIKMMMDEEVRTGLQKLSNAIETSGIELKPEDMKLMMQIIQEQQQKDGTVEDENLENLGGEKK